MSLISAIDSQDYILEFKTKFINFCEKAPIKIDCIIKTNEIDVINTQNKNTYSFKWDFTLPVKEFIHAIKSVLVEHEYPRFIYMENQKVPITLDERVELIASGKSNDEIPLEKIVTKKKEYLIDKVIVIQDTFIIKDLETEKMYLHKIKKSSVFFLKNLRSGKLTLEEAGRYFFNHSIMSKELIAKDEPCEETKKTNSGKVVKIVLRKETRDNVGY